MAGCQVNEDVLCKRWRFHLFVVAEILALLRPHVFGSAGLRPHFFVEDRRKERTYKSRPQDTKKGTFKTTFCHVVRPHVW